MMADSLFFAERSIEVTLEETLFRKLKHGLEERGFKPIFRPMVEGPFPIPDRASLRVPVSDTQEVTFCAYDIKPRAIETIWWKIPEHKNLQHKRFYADGDSWPLSEAVSYVASLRDGKPVDAAGDTISDSRQIEEAEPEFVKNTVACAAYDATCALRFALDINDRMIQLVNEPDSQKQQKLKEEIAQLNEDRKHCAIDACEVLQKEFERDVKVGSVGWHSEMKCVCLSITPNAYHECKGGKGLGSYSRVSALRVATTTGDNRTFVIPPGEFYFSEGMEEEARKREEDSQPPQDYETGYWQALEECGWYTPCAMSTEKFGRDWHVGLEEWLARDDIDQEGAEELCGEKREVPNGKRRRSEDEEEDEQAAHDNWIILSQRSRKVDRLTPQILNAISSWGEEFIVDDAVHIRLKRSSPGFMVFPADTDCVIGKIMIVQQIFTRYEKRRQGHASYILRDLEEWARTTEGAVGVMVECILTDACDEMCKANDYKRLKVTACNAFKSVIADSAPSRTYGACAITVPGSE